MITKEAIEAGVEAFDAAFNGSPNSTDLVTTILTAALAAMPATAVRVKALEWVNVVIGDGSPFRQQTWTSDRYQIVESPSGKFDLRHGAYAVCDTLEAAKAAAQADYEARILSALAHPPAKREVGETAPPDTPAPQSHVRVTDLHVEAAKLALVKHSVLMPTDAAIRDMLAAAASLDVPRSTTEGSEG